MVWYYKGLVIHLNDQMPNGNFPVLCGVIPEYIVIKL